MRTPFVLILLLTAVPAGAVAAEQGESQGMVVKTEQQSSFKGLLYSVWGKLRALSPKPANVYRSRTVATAGIRGAETTTSLITPYWKDDRTNDPGYIRELQAYTTAQRLAEQGELQAAVKALADFIDTHEDSDLRPNAQFALGITWGGLGNTQNAIGALQTFVNDNPRHPLVVDARQVIAQLQ